MTGLAEISDMQMWFSMFLIIGAIVGYATDRIAMEVTSIVLISVLLVFFHFFPVVDENGKGVINTAKLLMGFANPALITVLSLLVIGQAIIQTGALNEVANLILKVSRNNAALSIFITLLFVMIVSAFLNNTPVVVIFIPIMAALAKSTNISVSKVMIPLSFASILGGMTTLIGSSTNLLVSGIMTEMGIAPLGFFDFTIPGMIMASVGFIYVLLFVPKLLEDRASMVKNLAGEDDDRQFLAQIEIDYSSDLVGKQLENGGLEEHPEMDIRMVQRGEHAFLPPFEEGFVMRPRDIVVVGANKKDLTTFFSENKDSIENHFARFGDSSSEDDEQHDFEEDMIMAEIVVAPASKVAGKSLEETRFHREFNLMVLGVQRQSRVIRSKITEVKLTAGDVLLVMGSRQEVMGLGKNNNFLLMEWSTEEIHSGKKAGLAATIFGLVVGLAALDIVPIAVTSFAGASLVVITGCLNQRQAARSLDIKIVLMIAASLALGTALQATGGAQFIAQMVVGTMGDMPVIVIMGALFLLMAVLTNVLSNNAAAVLFTPIAINLAIQLEVDPQVFIFAVIFACNCSFITPIGYQTNLMVMGPGHHKFSDFIKSGIPLALIMWVTYCIFAYFYFEL